MAAPTVILYHYNASPYARRIVFYLTLRRIPYKQCLQPPTMPRPDLAALGVSYRRIPLLSINGDMYADTRLILQVLERTFPASSAHPALPTGPSDLAPLLSSFTVEAGVFSRAAQLMPPSLPALKNKRFVEDRVDFAGAGVFAPEAMARGRPEAMAHMRRYMDVYEGLLADGREWIGATNSVGTVDIEAVWPLEWMKELGSLEGGWCGGVEGSERYKRTWAWVARFEDVIKQAKKAVGKIEKVDGKQAANVVADGEKVSTSVEDDPTGLKQGAQVEVWPLDTGNKHRDRGTLVGLNKDEVVLEVSRPGGGMTTLHAPRVGFRVAPAKPAKL